MVGVGAPGGSVTLVPAGRTGRPDLAPLGLLALRGCPTCRAVGLTRTLSRGRLRRSREAARAR
ncbi:hypothetical protein [Streptomyces sp. A1499]|uniref:hypothetical protein n=1 Tax=Streptomyces sp. A1499 TaxID=2563104 RepID=UPI0019D22D00|nr:hypothetical protein [Streptomyces sp. A1499]